MTTQAIAKFSKSDEALLEKALLEGADLVEGGLDPDAALAKAAEAHSLPPGHVPLLARTFNIGRFEQQRQNETDAEGRAAAFPIADPAKIAALLYPEKPETEASRIKQAAISLEYGAPPEEIFRRRVREETNKKEVLEKSAGIIKAAADRDGITLDGVWHTGAYEAASKRGRELEFAGGQGRLGLHRDAAKAPGGPLAPDDKSIHKRAQLEAKAFSLRGEAAVSRQQMLESVSRVGDQLKSASCPPLDVLRENLAYAMGAPAIALLDYLQVQGGLGKRAERTARYGDGALDLAAEPYASFAQAVTAAEQYETATDRLAACEKEAADHRQQAKQAMADRYGYDNLGAGAVPTRPRSSHRPPTQASSESDSEKSAGLGILDGIKFAGIFDVGSAMAGNAFGKELASRIPMQRSTDSLQDKALMKLTDPSHEMRLRAIRSQAMLNDLMSGDEVISGYSPEHVAQHYNEIAQIAPRAAGQQGLVRAFLRKRLQQGALDPYEIESLVKLENGLKTRDAAPRPQMQQESEVV